MVAAVPTFLFDCEVRSDVRSVVSCSSGRGGTLRSKYLISYSSKLSPTYLRSEKRVHTCRGSCLTASREFSEVRKQV